MSFLSKVSSSKFLSKEDASHPMILTITSAKQENVAMENESPKMKVCLYFDETEKGFVLGKTTATQIASFLGDPGETPRPWYGKQVEIYNDPTVMFKGKNTGGLRVRQPRGPVALPAPQSPPPANPTSWQQAAPVAGTKPDDNW